VVNEDTAEHKRRALFDGEKFWLNSWPASKSPNHMSPATFSTVLVVDSFTAS